MKSARHGATTAHAGGLKSIGSASLRPLLDLPCPGHDVRQVLQRGLASGGLAGPSGALPVSLKIRILSLALPILLAVCISDCLRVRLMANPSKQRGDRA